MIKLGRALKSGESRIKIYFLQPNENEVRAGIFTLSWSLFDNLTLSLLGYGVFCPPPLHVPIWFFASCSWTFQPRLLKLIDTYWLLVKLYTTCFDIRVIFCYSVIFMPSVHEFSGKFGFKLDHFNKNGQLQRNPALKNQQFSNSLLKILIWVI